MNELTISQLKRCQHPRLGSRYTLAAICTVLLVPIIALLAALGAVFLWLFWIIFLLWAFAEVTYARLVDNHVEVSEHNYPRIHALAEEVRTAMGLDREISIFVYEQGDFNAWMTRLFRRRAIFLQSEVLEAGVTDNEVRWLVGRFVGYLRIQQDHGFFGRLMRIAEKSGIFTLLMLPYSRAMVYTGDRMGLAAIGGDIGSALSVMQKLLVGRTLGYSVNPLGIIEQRRRSKGKLFAFLARYTSPFPSTTARYVDLLSFAQNEYPSQFADFNATTSGLPDDLSDISGEYTSPENVWRAIGIITGLYLALLATFFWPMLVLPIFSGWGEDDYDSYNDAYYDGYAEGEAEDAMAMMDEESMEDAPADGTMFEEGFGGLPQPTPTPSPPPPPPPLIIPPSSLGEGGSSSSSGGPQRQAGLPADMVNITCIQNNTGRSLTYQMDYGDGNGWTEHTQADGTNLTHYTPYTDRPDIRFDYTLSDGKYVERKYWLRTSRSTSRNTCGSQNYRFTVENREIDMELLN